MLESELPAHQQLAEELLDRLLPFTGQSKRLGITGPPGVGKSTLIERLGMRWIESGQRVAVLAVDPSSGVSGGSILGDKSRMGRLAVRPECFIRPSPNRDCLGGVAHATRESMLLCEAAGFDVIMVETVGVGQSETAVHQMVDCFLLLALAGAGDELQGIKRGVMELADVIAVTKADGANLQAAKLALHQIQIALHLYLRAPDDAGVEAVLSSAMSEDGVDEIMAATHRFFERSSRSGEREDRRRQQAVAWFETLVREEMIRRWQHREGFAEARARLREEVAAAKMTPRRAAFRLLEPLS